MQFHFMPRRRLGVLAVVAEENIMSYKSYMTYRTYYLKTRTRPRGGRARRARLA